MIDPHLEEADMEDSLPHAASVLYVPAVLGVEVRVGLRGVALRQSSQDL